MHCKDKNDKKGSDSSAIASCQLKSMTILGSSRQQEQRNEAGAGGNDDEEETRHIYDVVTEARTAYSLVRPRANESHL